MKSQINSLQRLRERVLPSQLLFLVVALLLTACQQENVHCYSTPIMQPNGRVANVITSCDK